MKILLLLVGKTTNKDVQSICDDYVARLKHYTQFEITIIPELKNTKSLTQEQQKHMEGELIMKQLQPNDYIVLLDEHGHEYRSIEFANWIEKKNQTISRRLVFIIGGPYGFSKNIYEKTNEQLSVSKMTFSHQLIRIIFIEQLYRAFTIIKGEQYHHE